MTMNIGGNFQSPIGENLDSSSIRPSRIVDPGEIENDVSDSPPHPLIQTQLASIGSRGLPVLPGKEIAEAYTREKMADNLGLMRSPPLHSTSLQAPSPSKTSQSWRLDNSQPVAKPKVSVHIRLLNDLKTNDPTKYAVMYAAHQTYGKDDNGQLKEIKSDKYLNKRLQEINKFFEAKENRPSSEKIEKAFKTLENEPIEVQELRECQYSDKDQKLLAKKKCGYEVGTNQEREILDDPDNPMYMAYGKAIQLIDPPLSQPIGSQASEKTPPASPRIDIGRNCAVIAKAAAATGTTDTAVPQGAAATKSTWEAFREHPLTKFLAGRILGGTLAGLGKVTTLLGAFLGGVIIGACSFFMFQPLGFIPGMVRKLDDHSPLTAREKIMDITNFICGGRLSQVGGELLTYGTGNTIHEERNKMLDRYVEKAFQFIGSISVLGALAFGLAHITPAMFVGHTVAVAAHTSTVLVGHVPVMTHVAAGTATALPTAGVAIIASAASAAPVWGITAIIAGAKGAWTGLGNFRTPKQEAMEQKESAENKAEKAVSVANSKLNELDEAQKVLDQAIIDVGKAKLGTPAATKAAKNVEMATSAVEKKAKEWNKAVKDMGNANIAVENAVKHLENVLKEEAKIIQLEEEKRKSSSREG